MHTGVWKAARPAPIPAHTHTHRSNAPPYGSACKCWPQGGAHHTHRGDTLHSALKAARHHPYSPQWRQAVAR